jgi:osmoprotectant transport system permease protein
MSAAATALAASEPWIRWDWVAGHTDVILDATLQHIELTVVAVLGGLVIAAPLALLAIRWQRLQGVILSVGGILYTIPSLALFALLIPWTGLSVATAEIGLVSYTLLILIRNIILGIEAVPEDVRESARGMGYRPAVQLARVELPLAVPAILAGVRIATVTTIGLVTVTALMGMGGLGQLILDGLIRDFRTPLVVGGGLSVVLAVVADLSLARLQRALTPWISPR